MEEQKKNLAFSKINYIIMLVGIALIVLGFTIMSLETAPQGFGFLGLTLGPIVILSGFFIQFVAILYKPRK